MRTFILTFVAAFMLAWPTWAGSDFVLKASPYGVAKTIDRLESVLQQKGVTVFARIDHAAGAEKAGLSLAPNQVLIFGNPKLGTPLMAARPSIGLELPLKAHAWEDVAGKTWLSYPKPRAMAGRHGLAQPNPVIDKMAKILNTLTDAALTKP